MTTFTQTQTRSSAHHNAAFHAHNRAARPKRAAKPAGASCALAPDEELAEEAEPVADELPEPEPDEVAVAKPLFTAVLAALEDEAAVAAPEEDPEAAAVALPEALEEEEEG